MNRFATRVSIVLLCALFNFVPGVFATITLQSFTFDQSSIVGGSSQVATGTVTIVRGPSDTGGATVAINWQTTGCLNSSDTTVTIGSGSDTGTFTTSGCGPISANQNVSVTATVNGATLSASFVIIPFTVTLSVSPSTLVGGSTESATAPVSVSPPVKSNTTVSINHGATLNTPQTVIIAAGGSSASFSVTAGYITSGETDSLSTTVGVPATQNVTVNPLQVVNVSAPTLLYMNSNTPVNGTVTLNAPVSNRYVSVSSANRYVYMPNNPLVNGTTGSFTITPSA